MTLRRHSKRADSASAGVGPSPERRLAEPLDPGATRAPPEVRLLRAPMAEHR